MNRIGIAQFHVVLDLAEWNHEWDDAAESKVEFTMLETPDFFEFFRDNVYTGLFGNQDGPVASHMLGILNEQAQIGIGQLMATVVAVFRYEYELTDDGVHADGLNIKASRVMTRAEFDNAVKVVLP